MSTQSDPKWLWCSTASLWRTNTTAYICAGSNLAPNRNSKRPRSTNPGCDVCKVSKCLCWQFDIDTPSNWRDYPQNVSKQQLNEHSSLFSPSSDLLLWWDISSVHYNKVGSFYIITEFKLHPYDCMIQDQSTVPSLMFDHLPSPWRKCILQTCLARDTVESLISIYVPF